MTFGHGFVLPVSLDGEPGELWTLTGPRHTVIERTSMSAAGDLLFFATTDGPITHTADADPMLRFNKRLLGVVRVQWAKSSFAANRPR